MYKHLKCFFIFITVIIISLCAYFALPATTPVKLPPAYARSSVLLVPLDSRPVCTSLPQKLGQLAGLNVILPPKAYLDNYKIPAQQEKILQWLQYNSKFYKNNIISADMLLHGSLLEARKSIATPAQETALLNSLARLTNTAAPTGDDKAKQEQLARSDNRYAIFSIIPRLLVSDELLPDRWYQYQLLRYSELADMVRISGSYALTQKMRQTEQKIPAKVLQKYISQYQQSDRFNLGLLELSGSNENIRLIIGQDDASPIGLPHASADKLKAFTQKNNLTMQTHFTYGADEIAALLIAKSYLAQTNWQPKIFLKYADNKAPRRQMPYMAVNAAKAVENQISLLGAQLTENMQQADIICYINCGTEKNTPGKAQAQEIKKLLADGYKIAIIDSSKDYEPQQLLLPQLLKHNVPLSKLSAYAGWNTFSNSSGTALAQAVIFTARLRQLQSTHAKAEQIASLYAQNLNFTAERILEDFYYQKTIHPSLRGQLLAFGTDPTNLAAAEKTATERFIQSKLALNAFTLLHTNLGRTPFYSDGGKEYYLKSLAVSSSLPWNRIFEVDLNVWTSVGVK